MIETNMFNEKLIELGCEAGFTDAQIEWITEYFAFYCESND